MEGRLVHEFDLYTSKYGTLLTVLLLHYPLKPHGLIDTILQVVNRYGLNLQVITGFFLSKAR